MTPNKVICSETITIEGVRFENDGNVYNLEILPSGKWRVFFNETTYRDFDPDDKSFNKHFQQYPVSTLQCLKTFQKNSIIYEKDQKYEANSFPGNCWIVYQPDDGQGQNFTAEEINKYFECLTLANIQLTS